ncbi:MAG: phosphoesterase [Rhodospirillaceae bacterium]|nr:MAG: phosphoesterase [Rhodospirillaceae bacterium]
MAPMTRALTLLLFFGLSALLSACASPDASLPKVGHVFIIVLENEDYEASFGSDSPAKYLQTLAQKGATLTNYYGIGHASLDNYVAMISGQAPNPATQADCRTYSDFVSKGTASGGQEIGTGCVYPPNVATIANQLEAKGLSWKAYMEDMGNNPNRESATCGHPVIGERDRTQSAEKGDQYAARHNPFVYFHGIIDGAACAHVVNARDLVSDLRNTDTTPNFAFISPNLCNDGHDGGTRGPCVDGAPGGLTSADRYLAEIVPQILAAPAFKQDGLLIITFDEADLDGDYDPVAHTFKFTGGDATACCGELPGPNMDPNTLIFGTVSQGPGILGPGGGRIGAVMLSRFIAPGTVSKKPYNHYSLLRSLEDTFGLTHLGYAGQEGLRPFGADVFTTPGG